MNLHLVSKLGIAAFAIAACLPCSAATVALPYSNDFTSSSTDFVQTANWSTTTGGSGVLTFSTATVSTSGTAMLTATGIGGGTPSDFTVSTTFNVSANTDVPPSNYNTWGLALLANSTSPSNYILVDYGSNNLLRIINVGGSGTGADVSTSVEPSDVTFAINTDYTLSVTGNYTGTNLVLSASLTDGTDTQLLTAASFDTASFYSGSNMGLRARTGGFGTATTVSYDNFNLSVIPEPSSVLLGGLGLLALLRRRR